MGWQKPLNTEELEQVITSDMAKIACPDSQCPEVFFWENTLQSPEGTYVFSDSRGYHYVYSERGAESAHKITDDLFEIRFWVLDSLALMFAIRFEVAVRIPNQDSRRLIHYRYLELLDNAGANFKKRGEIRVSETLKTYPYMDDR